MHRLNGISKLRAASFGLLGLWLLASGCGGGISSADGSASAPASVSAIEITFEDQPVLLSPEVFHPDPNKRVVGTLEIVTAPSNGQASISGSQLRYVPNLNFFGDDQFDFSSTTQVGTIIGTATVTVEAVNDAPNAQAIALSDGLNTDEDTVLTISPVIGDVDLDPLIIVVSPDAQPVHGTVVVNGQSFDYTPIPFGSQNRIDSFSYTVSDGSQSVTAVVVVTITDVNHPPSGAQLVASVIANTGGVTPTETQLTPQVTDPDGDTAFTYTVASQPADGSVRIDPLSGNIVYTGGTVDFIGPDDFTFNVSDAGGLSLPVPVTASITVSLAPNRRPVLNAPFSLSTNEDAIVSGIPNVTDPDGDTVSYQIISAPAGVGNLFGGANIRYEPKADFNGTFTFDFQAVDPSGGQLLTPATATVTVTPVNDLPVVTMTNIAVTIPENNAGISIDLPFFDPDSNDSIPDTHVGALNGPAPAGGTVTSEASPIAKASILFVPATNFDGVVTFGFKVTDSTGAFSTGTVTVTVTNTNNPPTVLPMTQSVLQAFSTIFPTVSDPDPTNSLTLSVTVGASHGTTTDSLTNLSVRYEPNPGFLGVDQFTVVANDGVADSAPAVITVVVGKDTGLQSAPRDLVFGDFNGDGNTDIAIANATGDVITGNIPAHVADIYLGNGLGGLADRLAITPTNPAGVILGAIALAAGDLNGDAIDDLVIVYNDNDSYAVALGTPSALGIVASAPQPLALSPFPRAPVLANFDAGTQLDLALVTSDLATIPVNGGKDELVVLPGNGDGTFGVELARITLGPNTSPWDLASGDLNGDGVADLALVSLQRNAGALDLVDGFINDGTGTFVQQLNQQGPADVQGDADVATADLNGDGRADVVRTLAASNQVAVFLADLSGTLSTHTVYGVGSNPSGVAIADMNGDGLLDIATSNRGDNTITVLPGLGAAGTGDGTFGAPESLITHAMPWAIAAGNLDGVGGAEIATVHPTIDRLGVTFR